MRLRRRRRCCHSGEYQFSNTLVKLALLIFYLRGLILFVNWSFGVLYYSLNDIVFEICFVCKFLTRYCRAYRHVSLQLERMGARVFENDESNDGKYISSFELISIWCTRVFNIVWLYIAFCICDLLYVYILRFYYFMYVDMYLFIRFVAHHE